MISITKIPKGTYPFCITLLHPPMLGLVFREILETLNFENENPDIQLNASAISVALRNDLRNNQSDSDYLLPGTYIIDRKLHVLRGESCSLGWALNFTTPLLIECGFTITRKDILEVYHPHTERESQGLPLPPAPGLTGTQSREPKTVNKYLSRYP